MINSFDDEVYDEIEDAFLYKYSFELTHNSISREYTFYLLHFQIPHSIEDSQNIRSIRNICFQMRLTFTCLLILILYLCVLTFFVGFCSTDLILEIVSLVSIVPVSLFCFQFAWHGKIFVKYGKGI